MTDLTVLAECAADAQERAAADHRDRIPLALPRPRRVGALRRSRPLLPRLDRAGGCVQAMVESRVQVAAGRLVRLMRAERRSNRRALLDSASHSGSPAFARTRGSCTRHVLAEADNAKKLRGERSFKHLILLMKFGCGGPHWTIPPGDVGVHVGGLMGGGRRRSHKFCELDFRIAAMGPLADPCIIRRDTL